MEKSYLVRPATIYNKEIAESASIIPVEIFSQIDEKTVAVKCNINALPTIIEVSSNKVFTRLDEALGELQKLLTPDKSTIDEDTRI